MDSKKYSLEWFENNLKNFKIAHAEKLEQFENLKNEIEREEDQIFNVEIFIWHMKETQQKEVSLEEFDNFIKKSTKKYDKQ